MTRPRARVFSYPPIDDRLETCSAQEFHDASVWNREQSELMWQYYLPETVDRETPGAVPGRDPDLHGLPPTCMCTGELDLLRDEGLDFALRLMRSGGTGHGSLSSGTPLAAAEFQRRIDFIARFV